MQRTPPRRSSRLHKSAGSTPTNLEMSSIAETPATPTTAVDTSMSTRPNIVATVSISADTKGTSTNFATAAAESKGAPAKYATAGAIGSGASANAASAVTLERSAFGNETIANANERSSLDNAGVERAVFSSSTTSHESMFLAMQKQISALENMLKNTQVRTDIQYQNLQCALQNRTQVQASVASSSPSHELPTSATATSLPTSYDAQLAPLVPALYAAPCPSAEMYTRPTEALPSMQPTYSYANIQPSTSQPANYAVMPPSSNVYTNIAAGEMNFSSGLQFNARTTIPNTMYMLPPSRNSVDSSARLQPTQAYLPNIIAHRKLQDLPMFCGLAEDWPIYYSAYMQSTTAYNYTNLENNQRLQKCLIGEARETVKSLLIHPDNVGAIIDQLRFRFGRPDQLIRSQLKQVREITPIPENAVARIIPFATKTKNLSVFLQSVNGQQHLSNPTLLEELVLKLPTSKRVEWARYAAQIQPYPTIVSFSDWLSDLANIICTVQESEVRDPKRRIVLHAVENKQQQNKRPYIPKCPICQGQHKAAECKIFTDASVVERWSKVKTYRLCFSCLKAGHSTRDCRSKAKCTINGCQRRHHELLHELQEGRSAPPQQQKEGNASGEAVLSCTSNSTVGSKLLFRVLPVTLFGPNKAIDTYALLDEGSSVTMLDNTLVEELGLRGEQSQLSIQWVGGRAAQETTTLVNLYVCGAGMKRKHALKNVYGVSNLNLPTQSLSESDIFCNTSRSRRVPLKTYVNAVPKLLIGLDHCHLGLPTDSMHLNSSGPYAASTELGWVVFGPTARVMHTSPTCLLTTLSNDAALHNLVAEYFETESFGVRPSPPVECKTDARARAILQKTTKKIQGQFQTGLLWSRDDVKLPDSYFMALKRLVGIERKMQRDENYAAAYSTVINSYILKNYARKLQPAEAAITGPKTWYLPHFGVVNPNKPDKLRLVFDATAEVKGTSLNSFLLKGPQQYQPLPAVLFHFREGAIAVCGDIREMFHQILIQPEDRCAQRFLWRNGDDSKPPDVYEMVAMTFGAACSPCAAQHVKTINALDHKNHHPRAIKAIIDHHYVDDFVDSFESTEQAIQISTQVRDIHSDAGFELRNFSSNSLEVLNALKGASIAVPLTDKGSLQTEKVLGMYWQPATDNFKFNLKFHNVNKNVIDGVRYPTKRELLSIVMSVFDPLGFLSNFTICAKLLMREVWRHDLRWDEELPYELVMPWNKWREKLPDVLEFNVPRFYFKNVAPQNLQIHVFVDASEDAFAAVAYWRVENAEGNRSTAFISAKTRCAPLKLLTIPRLELQAAVLGTRLLKSVLEEHTVKVSRCILWSDSKTVLKWINSEHRRYKPFVAHRIAEILASTKSANWSWIPTLENVADEATRSNNQVDFSPTSRWISGPAFLLKSESCWPTDVVAESVAASKTCSDDDEEIRPKYSFIVVSNNFININRFSSLNRLIRTTAWVIRFVSRCRKQSSLYDENGLTALEISSAEVLLCRISQKEVFATELQKIDCRQSITKESALYKLSPCVDDQGLLRVCGRIDSASWLPYNTKRPIILPPSHAFTTLVVAHHHHRMKHQNVEATICDIRHKYWIPRLRQTLRKVISNCNVCKISRTMPVTPFMGPLPEDRLTPFVRPFTYTGLDYFGPLTVTIGRRTEKRWVALFTCLVVRAIHLEVAYDLSTDACILAIRNFINRRGLPVRIRSDNGTNFVGVDKEAKRFSEVFDCERVQDELSSKGVEWMFNCPANPSEGGVWERMVQCVKRVLRYTLKESAPREYTLQCFIIEAENVVNSRPLTHLPISADQEEPLTPNHFLLGSANTAQTPGAKEPVEKTCALRKQWRIARQLRDTFWKRWIGEYLPTLTRRAKWCQRSKPIMEGDLVLVCDVNVPRKQWCRGRIERVYPGADGEIRRADVRTSKGVMQRPVSKLAVLDVQNCES